MGKRERWDVLVHGVIDPGLAVTTEDFGGAIAALMDRSQEADTLLVGLHLAMTGPPGDRWPIVELALENAGWEPVPRLADCSMTSRDVHVFYCGSDETNVRNGVRRVLSWEPRRRIVVAVPVVDRVQLLDAVGDIVEEETSAARARLVGRPARFLGAAPDSQR